ncbi:prolipoprotein diacylglyceryl transferase [Mycobacterium sp. E2479]|uniref:prolipoprotein diacylglyceryl transferase n=1 Tax=Mycobacterium sp. E2479 TaxID=1834134 RepID=UPI0007FC84BB|nr:prolipoprotein diacylglyceryl transferase [Mycobacterium sp. E2479]OBH58622.1 prolipoprotein diacylglyceryl transferase [Mycobacterium sp. E2479]
MTKLLAYFPSPSQGVWHLGPLPIRAYALFIIAGIVVALLIGDRRWEARGGERGVIYDIALWAVPFGLIGGRLYHLATDWRTYWGPGGAGLGAAVRIWDGGLGIWGAVALGGVGAWIGCRRRGIPLPAFADALAPGIILAQAIGRLGNYFNQELYGRETTLPWGLEIFNRRDASGFESPHLLDGVSTGHVAFVVQPTFLYELIWNVLVFVALIYADRRFNLGHGRLFALYVAGYCVGRFGVELLRDDTATLIAGIRINSFTSTFVFIGAVVYLMAAPKGREDPTSLRGNEFEEEAADAESEDEPATVAAATAAAGAAAATGASAGSAETAEADDTTAAGAEAEEPVADSTEAAAEVEPSEAGTDELEFETDAEPETEALAEGSESGEPVAEAEELEAQPEGAEGEEPEAAADEPEAGAAESEESAAEIEEPEAEARAAAEDSEAEGSGVDEPEAESDEPAAEAEAEPAAEAEAEEPAEEPEAEPEAEEPEAAMEDGLVEEESDDEPVSESAETPDAETPDIDSTAPTESETEKASAEEPAETPSAQREPRRRWGSRLRNRLSGR